MKPYRPSRAFLVIVTAIGLAAGCRNASNAGDASHTPANRQMAKPPASTAGRPGAHNAVLATIGGRAITIQDLEDRLLLESPYVRTRYSSPEQKREFLAAMVRLEALAQVALAKGFGQDAAVVAATKRALADLYVHHVFDDAISPEVISDQDIEAYYASHQAQYETPPTVRVSAMVLASRPLADAARVLALSQANATAEGFAKLVDELSIDQPSRERHGDLRDLLANQAYPEIPAPVVAAAFTLGNVGDISQPIADSTGRYWIVRLTEQRPARPLPLAEVKLQVRAAIYDDLRAARRRELVEELRQSAAIKVDEAALAKIAPTPAAPAAAP